MPALRAAVHVYPCTEQFWKRQVAQATVDAEDMGSTIGRKGSVWPTWTGIALAWATLLVTLFLTGLAWQLAEQDARSDAERRFEFRVSEIHAAVVARMQAQRQVLRGAAGLFKASDHVTRSEWRLYVKALELEHYFPGIQGIGFAQRISPERLAEHIATVRAEGFSDYAVHPAGNRDEYTAIVYLEPFNWRNQRAFGYDMFYEPVRRAAMAAARDNGDIRISGRVTLVQEAGKAVQAGFLMYLPLYRRGAVLNTVEQRRDALLGYVYSPLRVQDLMEGILGRDLPDVRLQIYDDLGVENSRLMYDSARPVEGSAGARGRHPVRPARAAEFVRTIHIDIGGRPWTLSVTSLPEFEAAVPHDEVQLVLVAGVIISLLLFLTVWSLATLRERALLMATDMTAALRISREQFRAVTESANDAIVSADADGRIIYFNRAAEGIFGYPERDAVGQSLTLLMPERFQARHDAGFRRYLSTGEKGSIIGRTVELAGRRRDGSEFPLEMSVAAWETARGRFFTGILRDITERHRTEARIRQLNSELQRQVEQLGIVNRELESFSYSVSHDLRAPLRAVDGFAGMLQEDYGPGLDPEGQRLLVVIRDNARRMGKLIDDLLAFSRLGRASVSRSRVDMTTLCGEVIEELRAGGGDAARAEIVVGPLPPACGDGSLLRQVWINLIANGIKFSCKRDAPRIEIGALPGQGETVYFVRDNGVGFDMAYASQLFGVFQRLHSNEEFPGTGVGLAIVHRIVNKHGGRIWAEGEVGHGATFYFSLPGEEGDV